MESKVDFTSGVKYDTGKIRYDLVPPEIEEALAKVFTIGAIKYKPRNCETGFEYGRLLAAARRHIAEWTQGRDYDTSDTNLHHLTQAAWNLLMIYLCQIRGIGVYRSSAWQNESFCYSGYIQASCGWLSCVREGSYFCKGEKYSHTTNRGGAGH